MTLVTVYGTGTVTESGTGAAWGSLQNAKTSDNLRASTSCLYTFGTWGSCLGKTKLMNVPIATPTLTNGISINSVSIGVECYRSFTQGNGTVTIYYRYKYNGSWCSSYHSSTVTQSSDLWETQLCNHHAETISGLEAGGLELECYFVCSTGTDPTRVFWYVDAVRIEIDYNVATVPSAPTDPTLTVQSQSQLTVSSSSPSDGGSALDNVEQQISTSSTFSSGNITWTKGSAPTNPQTHVFTVLTAGTLYYARARYHNSIGWGNYNSSPYNSLYTLCATPSAPSITANAVGQLNIDWSGNPTTGARTTNAWEIRWSSTGTGDPSTWTLLGNYNLTTTSVNNSGIGNGVVRYYAVALYNIDNNISSWSSSGNGTTWDVPYNQDLVSATTPSGSMILSTRNSSYPSSPGTPPATTTSWAVWRSTSSGGTYNQIASGLTATTYEDWTVNGGEIWYYKAKFTNAVGTGTISTNPVVVMATTPELGGLTSNTIVTTVKELTTTTDSTIFKSGLELTINAQTVIKVIDNNLGVLTSDSTVKLITDTIKTTDTNIYMPASSDPISGTLGVDYFGHYDILSDTVIKQVGVENIVTADTIIKWLGLETIVLSDAHILKIGEISRVSTTRIHSSGLETTVTSNTAIKRIGYDTKTVSSDTRINRDGFDTINVVSFTKILNEIEIPIISNSVIFKSGLNITKTSDSRIVKPGTTLTPPIISDSNIKQSYEINTITSDSFIIYILSNTVTSDTTIFNSGYTTIDITSDTAVYRTGYQTMTKPSNTTIYKNAYQDITITSDAVIRRPGSYTYPHQIKNIVSDCIIRKTNEVLI